MNFFEDVVLSFVDRIIEADENRKNYIFERWEYSKTLPRKLKKEWRKQLTKEYRILCNNSIISYAKELRPILPKFSKLISEKMK